MNIILLIFVLLSVAALGVIAWNMGEFKSKLRDYLLAFCYGVVVLNVLLVPLLWYVGDARIKELESWNNSKFEISTDTLYRRIK
jgi:hypothetical protein